MKIFYVLSFLVLASILSAGTVTFHTDNALATGWRTWMFDYTVDNPYTPHLTPATVQPIFAFETMSYAHRGYPFIQNGIPVTSAVSSSRLIAKTAYPIITSTLPDTTLHLEYGDYCSATDFQLAALCKINTVNPNSPWSTTAQAGDTRIYGGATMKIVQSHGSASTYYTTTKVTLTDCWFTSTAPYPYNIGSGAAITGYGWGKIDPANSDTDWMTPLNSNDGFVEFQYSSFSSVVQTAFGEYGNDCMLYPATVKRYARFGSAGSLPSQVNSSSYNDMILDLTAGSYYYYPFDSSHRMMTNRIAGNPIGTFPGSVVKVYNGCYWEAGTTFNTFTGSLTFDLSNIPGIQTPANLRIMQRQTGYGTFFNVVPSTIISTNPLRLRVDNLNVLGQFALGSTGGNNLEINTPLQVTVTHISAPSESVRIDWDPVSSATQYHIYYSDEPYDIPAHWGHLATVPVSSTHYSLNPSYSKKFFYVTAEK